MKDGCVETGIGKLLHAYELRMLPNDLQEKFELHLLKCEHCFAQLKQHSTRTEMLRSDPEVLGEIGRLDGDEQPGLLKRLSGSLWPDGPLLLRPAVTCLVILLLLAPAYLGIVGLDNGNDGIRPVQIVNLSPTRAIKNVTFRIDHGVDGLLQFYFEGAMVDSNYIVTILDDDRQPMMADSSFKAFDQYGTGSLLIPVGTMKTGDYHLILTGPTRDSPSETCRYRFRISG